MHPPLPPHLITLHTTPSWHNRRGRTDRSACLELRTSDLHLQIPHEHWNHAPTFPKPARRPGLRQQPPATPQTHTPHTPKIHREVRAQTTITAPFLLHIHDRRPPYLLRGDMRTAKSNAMKSPRHHLQPTLPLPHAPPIIIGNRISKTINHNRGATRTKSLGLPPHWSQSLTVERWRLHPKLAQHFLICPRCAARNVPPEDRKYRKLFLPLCTPQEFHDAQLAHAWLQSLRPHKPTSPLENQTSNLPGSPLQAQIFTRYAPLFPPRSLLCKSCLPLRYGHTR